MNINDVRLYGLGLNLVVSKVIVFYEVEIISALADRKMSTPIVLHPFILYPAADGELADPIGPGSKRGFHCSLGDVTSFPVVFRQDWDTTQCENNRCILSKFWGDMKSKFPRAHCFYGKGFKR